MPPPKRTNLNRHKSRLRIDPFLFRGSRTYSVQSEDFGVRKDGASVTRNLCHIERDNGGVMVGHSRIVVPKRPLAIALVTAAALLFTATGASAITADNIVPTTNSPNWCYSAIQADPKNRCRTDNSNVSWWMDDEIGWTTSSSDLTPT